MGRVLGVFGLVCLAACCATAIAFGAANTDAPDVLVSRQLFVNARLAVGEVVTIADDAQGTRSARFRVAGVYEPTPDPMKFNVERLEARLHLDDLMALTDDPSDPAQRESVTGVNFALVDANRSGEVAGDLARRLPTIFASPTARASEGRVFVVLDRFHRAIAVVTVIGSTAFLLALMVIRAEERRETVGILRLIGISRQSILFEVLIEGLIIAIAGAVFGVVFARAAEHAVNGFFQARYDTALVFVRVTPSIALRSVALAVPAGVLAGALASWTLLRRSAATLVKR